MQRRKFLLDGAALSASLALSSRGLASIGSIPNLNEKVNIGIIGTGSRGKGLLNILKTTENINVVACCDIIPFRLEEALQLTDDSVTGYSNYLNLLDDTNVDAVIVSVPFYLHARVAIDAINADKHVYCEKTLAKGYEDIARLVDKVKKSTKIFQVGHQYHSSRLYRQIVDLIKRGKVGNVLAFECQWNRNGDWRRPVKDPTLERQINWRMYKDYSGGLLAELSSHQIEFVNWVLDAHPEKVMGMGGVDYWKDGRQTYDNIHMMYSYPNGVTAKFTCLTANAKGDYRIKVIGDKGIIEINYDEAWFFPEEKKAKIKDDIDGVSGATAKSKYYNAEQIKIAHANPSKQALLDFRDNIIENKEPESNISTGARAAIAVQMGLDALYSNRPVSWDPEYETLSDI